jgi:hypothetical protein
VVNKKDESRGQLETSGLMRSFEMWRKEVTYALSNAL